MSQNTPNVPLTPADERLLAALDALPQDFWDFRDDNVREYTHGLHNYPAMMVCPISRNILRLVSEIRPVETLLDPFAGSGTVLVEGMLSGVKTIYGSDINPFALYLSRVKTTRLNMAALTRESSALLARIDAAYRRFAAPINRTDEAMQSNCQLDLTAKTGWGAEAPKYLRLYVQENALPIAVPDFKNIGYWFKPRVILLLSLIKAEINTVPDDDLRAFFFAAFSETIRFVSNRRNGEFKLYRMPPQKVASFAPDVIAEFAALLTRNIEKMRAFDEACENIETNSVVSLVANNAASLEDIPDSCADLVVTSPPYGDSRTTVAYGEYSRLSLQWIDLFSLTEQEIMGIDRTLMGGRKYRDGFTCTVPSSTLQASLARICAHDLERAGDVYSFYLDLSEAIAAVARKTRSGGYQFWVVGNRTVKGEKLLTDRIIAEIAAQHGLVHLRTVERSIINKVMPSLNSPTNEVGAKSATMSNEHIVVLRKQ